jgi:hypothetical protein
MDLFRTMIASFDQCKLSHSHHTFSNDDVTHSDVWKKSSIRRELYNLRYRLHLGVVDGKTLTIYMR